ncbi:MAG: hypothetical protein U0M13_09110, partial [Desulfovibrio fairfieldensis]|nr:hypothetical protein [Desulfovibrio fairfieldensis]
HPFIRRRSVMQTMSTRESLARAVRRAIVRDGILDFIQAAAILAVILLIIFAVQSQEFSLCPR